MTAQTSHPSAQTAAAHGPQRLVLLGGSLAHLQLLVHLATHPLPHTEVVLVASHASLVVPTMLAGFVAGRYALDDCAIPLEPLVQRSGVRWMDCSVQAVDLAQQTLQLDNGDTLGFDWLSINTNPVQDRNTLDQSLPGAREHGLFLRPIEVFAALWPRVVTLAEERALRIAVVGADAGGLEIALAARQRLPNAAVTLVCGTGALDTQYTPAIQQQWLGLMKRRGVTVLQDNALALDGHSVQLGCGANLACDVPILALGPQAPLWLAGSGLALDAQGFPAVDIYQRSTSHGRVFAAQTGSALAHNLAAAMAGTALKAQPGSATALSQASGRGRYALGNWRSFRPQARWLWWFRHWRDRRLVARLARPAA